jgi:hypothetical protein
MLGGGAAPSVDVLLVGGEPVGFYRPYAEAAMREETTLVMPADQRVLARTACAFFIPDKLRVYRAYVRGAPPLPEPAAGLRALRARFAPVGVTVVDLTPALRAAAAAALARGRLVFWRDDTHWNGAGVRAVAPMVRDCVGARLRRQRRAEAPAGATTAGLSSGPGRAR